MSSVQNLRELINQRLTAAAEEIFSEFEKTIVQYEEVIDRQRRLLDITWRPAATVHAADLPQQHVCKEGESLADQQLCNLERNFSLDQEPPQIKEEQEELCTSLDQEDPEPPQIKVEQEELCTNQDQDDPEPPQIKDEQEELCISQQEEQIILKQVTDFFLSTSTDEDNDHSELEPNRDQLLFYESPVAESPHQEGSKHVNSGSTRNAGLKPQKSHNRNSSHTNNADNSSSSESHCDTNTGRESEKHDAFENTFKNKYQIEKHHQIHKGAKPYACNACGKSFSFSPQLKVHMMIHKDEKGFSCKTCGKHFSRSSRLTVHMRTHTGEKPYSCETCGKRFTQNINRIVHMRIHTGEKPYSCETCGKRFTQYGSLLSHLRTHRVFGSEDKEELRRVQKEQKRKIRERTASYKTKMETYLQQNNAREV